ncbi:hypothetical protein BYT27DRAFT_7189517 [Phlegmacium glaucopus]|nr:hypothetical protein BYT27DRAFT_7189517 [Phlegmacium glaucopus]
MVSEYQKKREENMRKNKELLISLGLDKPMLEPKETRMKKRPAIKKRHLPETSADDEDNKPPTKAQRVDSDSTSGSSLRRSVRNVGKTVDYQKEVVTDSPVPVSISSGVKTSENSGPLGRQTGKRRHDPKTFGSIPGIEVGTWWETRAGCSADSIHAPWVGGISGGPQGAYSVVISGGYEDDIDLGYAFTYTGSGGRDLRGTKNAPKNLRTAPQSSDQTFVRFNRMLQRSSETKRPVRVIRGFKLKSRYAPYEGYRYDGLYRVEKAWLEKGLNPKGYLVCKFAFKRLPGQPALPVQGTSSDDDAVQDGPNMKREETDEDEDAVQDDSDMKQEETDEDEDAVQDESDMKQEDTDEEGTGDNM